MLRRVLVIAVLGSSALVASPGARSQAQSNTAEALLARLVQMSDVVVVGRIEHLATFPSGPQGQAGIHTQIQTSVEETLLGAPRRSLTFWVPGGRYGDSFRVLSHQSTFRASERVLIFLRREETALWPASMSDAKWSVRVDDDGPLLIALSARGGIPQTMSLRDARRLITMLRDHR